MLLYHYQNSIILKQFFTSLLIISSCLHATAQYGMNDIENRVAGNYTVKTIFYKLGSSIIPIKTTLYGNRNDLVYINLHDDEFTSVGATRKLLKKQGGLLIELENKGRRDLRFRIGNIYYSVDPNRIFAPEGISISLKEKGRYSAKARQEVEKLGQRIVQLFPKNPICIIALHNNTPDYYSITEYLPGNKRTGDAAKVNANPDQDPDDLYFIIRPNPIS